MIFRLWLCACLSWSAMALANFQPRPVMERRKITDPGQQFKLLEQGRVNFSLLVPAGSEKAADTAATELAAVLEQVCGTPIEVHNQRTAAPIAIMLGERALQAEFGQDCREFDRDGFVILSKPGLIVIAGRDSGASGQPGAEHGTLFGVYEFLERFVGVRFYFPGPLGTVVPKKSDLSVPGLDLQDRPDFQARNIYWWAGPNGSKPAWYDDSDPAAGKSLQWRRLRLETQYVPCCHGLAYLTLTERFADSQPEYFALAGNGVRLSKNGGQLCFSSKVTEEIYQDAVAALSGKPASSRGIEFWRSGQRRPFFDLMPNDGMLLCHCEQCKQHQTSTEISKFIWDFVCDTGERLQKEQIAGYLTFSSYSPYREIPERAIPDNVLVMKALTGPYLEAQPEMYGREIESVLAWQQKLQRKIWLWNYAHKLYGPAGIPNMIPRSVGSFYARMAPYIFGALLESESDVWLSDYLGFYVFAKVAWDNKTDVEQLLSEHHRLMFAAAAEPMRQIYEIFEEKWLQIVGQPVETNLGPRMVKPTRIKLWNEIYSPAERAKISGLFDQARQLVQDDQLALARVRLLREQLWQPALAAAEDYQQETNAKVHWYAVAPKIPEGDAITLDGQFREDAWQTAKPFYLLPLKGDRVQTQTTVRLLRDAEYLYLAFACLEPNTEKMLAIERALDDQEIWRDNSIEIFLNPDASGKNYCQIIINSQGSLSDQYIAKPGTPGDWQWNSDAVVKTAIVAGKQWQVEVAVPLKNLVGLNPAGFTADFCRSRVVQDTKAELYRWSLYGNGFHDVENYGRVLLEAPAERNLLKNGDFSGKQSGRFISPWAANEVIYQDHEVFLSGGASLRLDKTSTWVTCSLAGLLKPDTEYIVSYYVKADKVAAPGGLSLRLHDGGGKSWKDFPNTSYYGTFDWLRQEMKIRTEKDAGTNSHPATLAISFRNGVEGTAWIDKVELQEVK